MIMATNNIDKENLITKIWCDNKIITEINSEKSELEIEFVNINGLLLNLGVFLEAINIAKSKL